MGSARLIIALSIALVFGCRSEEPLAGSGVTIETELVEQVCRGTIVHAESELARIEAELALSPMTEQVEIHVIDPERIGEYCPARKDLCVLQPPRAIYVSAEVYNPVLTRELIRDRLARSPVGSTKPMFSEGIATALTRPMCRARPSWDPPTAEQLLSKGLGTSLSEEELYLAGELLRWLIDTHGPEPVLDFMARLDRSDTPDEVRVAYLERFGGPLELDLNAHWRPADEPLAPERAGCLAPEVRRDEVLPRLLLEASFDCNSPRVRSDFSSPGRGFVEWTLTIDEHTAGTYYLSGELPDGVELTLSTCECRHQPWTQSPPGGSILWDGGFHPKYGAHLSPGVYRLRAYGPIGSSFEYEILAPCDYARQDCPAGQQCTTNGHCHDEVENPGQMGDSCWPSVLRGGPALPCAAGLLCVGPVEGDGVCMVRCDEPTGVSCSGDLTCGLFDTCTESCDPFAASCAPAWTCVPSFDIAGGGCYPFPLGDLGPLEPCSMAEFSCAPGLWCENHPELDGCHNPDSFLDFSGCCTPICDATAPDPGCPPELPNCEVWNEDNALGLCQP